MKLDQIRSLLQTPEVIVQTWRAARKANRDLAERDVRDALVEFEPLWNELFPAEQSASSNSWSNVLTCSPTASISACGSKGLPRSVASCVPAPARTTRPHDQHSHHAGRSIWSPSLLWRTGAGASGSCPAGCFCPGGAEVVRRMAPHVPRRIS